MRAEELALVPHLLQHSGEHARYVIELTLMVQSWASRVCESWSCSLSAMGHHRQEKDAHVPCHLVRVGAGPDSQLLWHFRE